ncbi:hypothetical protein ACFFMN_23210 [Planobispora siamensis]|uniref:N-acetyltransferase domain-containing protein n=1 Tax=Planobispora siamensis TaxID=936338 RepID=A0A8J3SMG0_9ACTN|nr:hypothetical protein [Planobispora siamensis]GIH95271.1 hypothetical protein Psi01_59010 [Planobispora siamensis]
MTGKTPAPTRYSVRPASRADLRTVADLLAASARWMHGRGYDAWPPDGFPDERILLDIDAGTCWIVHDRQMKRDVATFVLDSRPDMEFIAAGLAQPDMPVTEALILHRMAVARDLAGTGISTLILDWATDRTARASRDWLWINVARRARPLQAWYVLHGFDYITTVTMDDPRTGLPRKSGTLMRRAATEQRDVHRQIRLA